MSKTNNKVRADVNRTEQQQRNEIIRHNERNRIAMPHRQERGRLPSVAVDTTKLHDTAKLSAARKLGLRLAEDGLDIKRIFESLGPSKDWLTYKAAEGYIGSVAYPGEKLWFSPRIENGTLKSIRITNSPQPQLVDGTYRPRWDPVGDALGDYKAGGKMPWQNPVPDVGFLEVEAPKANRCTESNLSGDRVRVRRSETELRALERQLVRFLGDQRRSKLEQPMIRLTND